MKVLFVDDEEIIVQGVLKHISKLKELDITAAGAFSGEEALAMMKLFRPDLLITDIHMPGMNGLDLIQEVQRDGLCPRCIVLTAYEEFEYARRALEMGVLGYMVKPIDWDELDNRLRQLCGESQSKAQVEDVLRQYEPLYAHTLIQKLSPTLRKITRYIQKNYANDLSLMQLSCQTGLTESYICILFKKELDITFLDYVNELRLYQAMRILLESPKLPVRNVAPMVGYHSERQLYRLFNTLLNITPQQFRDQCSD